MLVISVPTPIPIPMPRFTNGLFFFIIVKRQWKRNKLRSKRIIGSSRSQMFFKIGTLKNFAICSGKQLCWSLFSIMDGNFIKMRLQREYCEIFKKSSFYRTLSVAASK